MAEDTIVSGKDEGGYGAQLSIKFGNNCMINIRANDVQGLIAEANALGDSGAFLVGVAEDLQTHAISSQQAVANVQAVFPQTAPIYQPAAPAPPPSGVMCAHGVPMTFRNGVKNGKAWSGHFCQVKNDPTMPECAPRFGR